MHARYKLRPRELFFALTGLASLSALGLMVVKVIPQEMDERGVDAESLSGLAALLASPAAGLGLVGAMMLGLSAGISTRLAKGSDRATAILGGVASLAMVVLLAGVRALWGSVFGPS